MFKLEDSGQKLVIGLGNIGNKYTNTWHNAGFKFADRLVTYLASEGYPWDLKEKDGYLSTKFSKLNLTVLKPQTMMNSSGIPTKHFLKYTEVKPENILLAHDDLDIEFGKYKLSLGKSPRSHNGVVSVEKQIGFTNFYRLRIGVETRTDKFMSGKDYVLSQIRETDQLQLTELFDETIKILFV